MPIHLTVADIGANQKNTSDSGQKQTMDSRKIIIDTLEESLSVKEQFIRNSVEKILEASNLMAQCLKNGSKILLMGNGGSAADAQHIAAEFVNRFQMERPPLAAIALTTDTSILTSIGNDYSFEDIFYKQTQALGREGDIAICITTSGNSANILKAAHEAISMGIHVIGMSGNTGNLKKIAKIPFCVDSTVTARIQESHITLAHILCDLTERILFE
ncbi:D-sedoheptulose 7-phosphate isomerase [Desulfamplus magnetovallimortis]|uniref:D-sedoheptulose-7-phosphate isomerase n=1 Tax=Desulfamplus magnetovallimortis TaxID=1246637 RepID=UPI0031840C20